MCKNRLIDGWIFSKCKQTNTDTDKHTHLYDTLCPSICQETVVRMETNEDGYYFKDISRPIFYIYIKASL